jgi:outer membrane protein assembly factor BamB
MGGNLLWKKPMPIPITQWGTGTSPILAADQLILVRDQYSGRGANKRSAYVLALNPKDGTTIWSTERPSEPSWSTPIVRAIDGTQELVVFGRRRLIAYDLRDGSERWSVDGLPLDAVGVPVTGSGLIFVAGTEIGGDPERPVAIPGFNEIVKQFDRDNDGKISQDEAPRQVSIDPRDRPGAETLSLHSWFWQADKDKDGLATREEWIAASEATSKRFARFRDAVVAIRPGGNGDVTDTNVVWRVGRGVPDSPSPLYHEGLLYLIKTGGIVSCLDAKTGQLKYRSRLGSGGAYSSSPVVANSNIYVASERGGIVVFRTGDKLDVLANNDLGDRIMATPAFVDSRIYVRTDNHLYAFGE